MHRSI